MSRHHIVVDPDKEIYMKCHDCQMWGSPSYLFLEKCGNCHSENVSIYYPRLKEQRLTQLAPDAASLEAADDTTGAFDDSIIRSLP